MNQATGQKIFGEQLLCFIPFIPEGEVLCFVFFRCIQKTKSFTAVLGMLSVVNIMSVYHASKIFASFFRTPLQSLMNNNIVKDNIKSSVAEYPDRDGQHIGVVGDLRKVIKNKDRRDTENDREKIVTLKR